MSSGRFACQVIALLYLCAPSYGAVSRDPDCVIKCSSGKYADDTCMCAWCPDIHCDGTQALSEFDKTECKNLKFVCPSMFKTFAETEASGTKSTSLTPTTISPATMTAWNDSHYIWLVIAVAVLLLLFILSAITAIALRILCSRRPKPSGDDLEVQGQQPRRCWQMLLCCCHAEEKDETAEMDTLMPKMGNEGTHPDVNHPEGADASEQMLGSDSENLQSEPPSSENSQADSDAEDFNSQNPSIPGVVQAEVHCDNCSADNAGNTDMEQQRNREHSAGNGNTEQQRNREHSSDNFFVPQMPEVAQQAQKVTCLKTPIRQSEKIVELKLKVEQTSDPKQPPETPHPAENLPDQQV